MQTNRVLQSGFTLTPLRVLSSLLLFLPLTNTASQAAPIRSDFKQPFSGAKRVTIKFDLQTLLNLGATSKFTDEQIAPPTALPGFTDLLPFVLRSPDQQDAGSCLYMSLTGTVEWWLAKLNPELSREPDGPVDLSERYLMNLAGIEEAQNGVTNWKTDSIYLLNAEVTRDVRPVTNHEYRFTMGWFTDKGGTLTPATETTAGAAYSTEYNWIDESPKAPTVATNEPTLKLPHFGRDILFADPASNQWNVGIATPDLVSQIQAALKTNQAPVNVIYNHFGYWHAVMIVGYTDRELTKDCPFVERSRKHLSTQAETYAQEATTTADPNERERLLKLAEKYKGNSAKLEASYLKNGGCHHDGTFYVRDSIYQDDQGPTYDYDLNHSGEEAPYGPNVTLREFDWVLYLVNHAIQVKTDTATAD